MNKEIFSKILGTGSHLPKKVMTNADLEKIVDTTDQWIQERTGIKQRHIASEGETTSSLSVKAALHAIEMSGVDKHDIDLIIVATATPDLVFPSTACLVQKQLDIHGCAAFDVQAACTGFVYAMSIADKFIKSGTHKHVLVIGAETISRVVDWTDRSTCILFGDGAGAVILGPANEPGIISTHIHADGQYDELLRVPAGVSTNYKSVLAGEAFIEMKGNEVFKRAVNTLGDIVDKTLEENNLDKSEIDWLVPHQANIRIIQATAKKLKMGMDRVVVTVGEQGNTSAATIPLALDTAVRDGRIKSKELILMEAFGGGFTWGSVLVKY